MTDIRDWQGKTGAKWADEWRRTDRSFGNLTPAILARVRERPFRAALDVGCGAGELSLAVAREHSRTEVLGIDISESLVATARQRGEQLGNVRFEHADASQWTCDDPAPDLVMSRHGVMFFDDPASAFAHIAAQAAPAARLVFSCFRDRSKNAWATDLVELLPPGSVTPPAPGAPGPFAFAETGYVQDILSNGGWGDIDFEPIDFAYIAGAGGDPIGDALTYFMSIGPAAAVAAGLSQDERESFIERLERFLESRRDGSIVALPAAAWIVTARKS